MLMLFLAAAVGTAPVDGASVTSASASARATVRIVKGAEVRFGTKLKFEASVPRQTTIREQDGSTRTASLIEFY